jgi:hypothetical protein
MELFPDRTKSIYPTGKLAWFEIAGYNSADLRPRLRHLKAKIEITANSPVITI